MKPDAPSNRKFRCEKCELLFEALVAKYEAGLCPKCKDTEWVIRTGYDAPDYRDYGRMD